MGPLLYEGSLFSDVYIHCVYVYMYHKGAVAPLYIGIVQVGQHRSHTCKIYVSVAMGTQSEIRLHERVATVKIWGSSKNDRNLITGKLLKL